LSVHRGELEHVLECLLPEESFAHLSQHGNAEWTPHVLASVAVMWAWQSLGGLVVRFETSRRVTAQLIPGAVLPGTYQAFVKALAAHSEELIGVVLAHLRQRMQQGGGEFWTVGRWCVFAFDGTRLRTPRTVENQDWFDQPMQMAGRRRRKSRKTQRGRPQAWLTVCWHVGWGLPWAFRHGPGGSSETHHARDMLGELPPGSLVTADAGFTGYDLLRQILDEGHQFLVRVGANVRLLRSSGYIRRRGEFVFLWPDKAVRKSQPPLVLRVIRVHDGRQPMMLVTSIRDSRSFSDSQALAVYRRRWGIEVFLRTFKVTFEKGVLLSRSPHNAERELAWSLMALWSVQLMGGEQLIVRGFDPADLSTATALRALQVVVLSLSTRSRSLLDELAALHDDGYERRDKSSRNYPRKKKDKPPSVPKLQNLKPHHRTALRNLKL